MLTQLPERIVGAILNSTHDGIMLTNSRNVIIYVNKAFSHITGYQPDDILGEKPSILKSYHHEPEFYDEMWRTLLEDNEWEGEIWDRRKNGEVYLEHLRLRCFRDESGEIEFFLGIFSYITNVVTNE